MAARNFTEHVEHLLSLRDLQVDERVVVEISGRTGTLARRCRVPRDGWIVRWDEPVFGVTEGRVATHLLSRVES